MLLSNKRALKSLSYKLPFAGCGTGLIRIVKLFAVLGWDARDIKCQPVKAGSLVSRNVLLEPAGNTPRRERVAASVLKDNYDIPAIGWCRVVVAGEDHS